MLVQLEDDEDRRGSDGEPFGGSDRHDFMSALKAEFFLEGFGQNNAAKHALRRGVEIVGCGSFGAVLKVRDRHVVGQREILCPDERP